MLLLRYHGGVIRMLLFNAIFLLIPLALLSQISKVINYTVEDGLPGNEVYDVLQDDEGYMWFSTDRGVSRYNGYEFQNFTTADGLKDNTVFSMYKDDSGRIWFLSYTPELCYFENNRFKEYSQNHLIRKLKLGKTIGWEMVIYGDTIYVQTNGGITYWVTGSGDISCYQVGYGTFANGASVLIKSVKLSENHYKWLVKKINLIPGINNADFAKSPAYIPYVNDLVYPFEIKDRFTRNIFGNDTIWNIEHALWKYSGDSLLLKRQFQKEILFIYRDRKGLYWVSFADGGIDLFRDVWNDRLPLKHYFENQGISAMKEDHEGGKWFTSLHNGVFYSPPDHGYVMEIPEEIPSTPILDLVGNTKGEVFAGYKNGAIWKIDNQVVPNATLVLEEQNNYFEHYPLFYDTASQELFYIDKIMAIHWKSESALLRKVNKQRGYDKIEENKILFIPEIVSIESDQNKGFYTVTNLGYCHFSPGKDVDAVIRVIDKRNSVFASVWCRRMDAMYVENGEPRYIASPEGIFLVHKDTTIFIGDNFPLLKGRFDVIKRKGQKEFYLGSRSNGLIIWSEDTIYRIDEKSGLPGNQVKAIELIGESEVWVGTDKGLCRMTKTADGKWKFRNLNTTHGLPSVRINTLLYNGQYLYVGTDRGLSKLNTDKLTESDVSPGLYLTNVKVNGNSVPFDRTAEFAFNENQIYLNYIGLNYMNEQPIEYLYKLEGLEDEWQSTTNREARYDFLPPGEYTFLLSTVSENGTPGNIVSWSFSILKPFWLRWWFFVIEGLVLILLITSVVMIRERNLRKSLEVKQRMIELELKALRSQMNPHFTFNTLASIQQYILQNETSIASDYIASFATLIRKVLENSKKDLVPLDEELETIRMYLHLESMRFDNQLTYEIVIPEDFNTEQFLIPSMIIQPYLENAILHGILPSKSQGFIKIVLEEMKEAIKVIITDNGIGRERSMELKKDRIVHNKSDSLGMQITAERLDLIAEAHKSPYSVKVSDVINEKGEVNGTRVEICFPHNTDLE